MLKALWAIAGGIGLVAWLMQAGDQTVPPAQQKEVRTPALSPELVQLIRRADQIADTSPLEAISLYDEAIGINADLPLLWFNKGLTHEAVAQGPEALACYHELLRFSLHPDQRQDVDKRMGFIYRDLKNHTGSSLYLGRAAHHARVDYRLSYIAGQELAKVGKFAQAVELFETCAVKDRETPVVEGYTMQAGYALSLHGDNRAKEGEAWLTALLKPDRGQFHLDLATLIQDAYPEQAVAHLKQAISSAPRQFASTPHYVLGRLYHNLHLFEEEADLYASAVDQGIWGHAMQRPAYYYSTSPLRATPWWAPDPRLAPALHALESGYEAVMEDLRPLVQQMSGEVGGLGPDQENLAAAGKWHLGTLVRNGHKWEETWRRFPRVSEVLEPIFTAFSQGMPKSSYEISVLGPQAHIKTHCGPTNHRLRLHLGLVVPKGCSMRVHDDTRTWEEGKAFAFDDSFEHEVWNESPAFRAVLIVDVWHPDLTEEDKQRIREDYEWEEDRAAVQSALSIHAGDAH